MVRTRQPQTFTRPAATGLGRGMQLLLNPALGGGGILDVATGVIWTASGAMTKTVSTAGIASLNGGSGAHYTSVGYSNITGKRGTLFMYAPSVGLTDANGHVLFGESTSAAYWQCSYNGGVPYGWGTAASGATSTWFNGANRSIVFANDGTGFSVWINGVFIGSAASSTAIPTGSKTMRCMGWPGGSFDPENTQFLVLGYTSETWDQRSAQSFHLNPHQVYADARRVVVFGAAAGGVTDYALDAQPGGYSVSGTAATLARGLVIDAQPATYAVSGTAASIVRGYNLNAAAGTFTATGAAAGLLRALSVNAGPGTYEVTGAAAGLDKTTAGAFSIDAQPGTYTLTGTAATLTYTPLVQYALDAQPGIYSLTGAAATLVYTPLNAYTLNAQPGTYAITGAIADLFYSGGSIWTDVGVSAATWSDVGPATSIWTDI